MPQYRYRAKGGDGSVVTGILQAESERNALDSLDRLGVFPLEIRSEEAAEAARAPRHIRRRIRPDDVALFTRQLGDLLRAGVSVPRALGTLSEQTSNQELAKTIKAISKEVSAGKTFHEAFLRHPRVFSPLYVSMIKAGEAGGFLEDVLHRLAGFIEKDEELRSRIRSSLAYPTLLLTIGFLAVAFLMVYFIPRFSEIFKKMGGNLPMATQIVMGASYFMREYWFAVLAAIVAGLAGWRYAGSSSSNTAARSGYNRRPDRAPGCSQGCPSPIKE